MPSSSQPSPTELSQGEAAAPSKLTITVGPDATLTFVDTANRDNKSAIRKGPQQFTLDDRSIELESLEVTCRQKPAPKDDKPR